MFVENARVGRAERDLRAAREMFLIMITLSTRSQGCDQVFPFRSCNGSGRNQFRYFEV